MKAFLFIGLAALLLIIVTIAYLAWPRALTVGHVINHHAWYNNKIITVEGTTRYVDRGYIGIVGSGGYIFLPGVNNSQVRKARVRGIYTHRNGMNMLDVRGGYIRTVRK